MEQDWWKTAFAAYQGTFEPTVMFYGITNSPAVFQIMINYLFWDFINQEIVVVYMDNILIYIKDMEEYNKVIEEVLMILKDNSLFLKPEKCVWRMNKVEYIRMIISDEGVHMSSEKVNAIKAWKKLKNVREVRSFLGFANYYCYFIKDFAKIAKLLVQLTHKDIEWSWTSASQTAFDHLKKKFSEEPVLAYPDSSQPMWLRYLRYQNWSSSSSQKGWRQKLAPMYLLFKKL